MKLLNFNLLKQRKRRVTPRLRIDDPTANWTPREWADLPVHHPRYDDTQ